ncbi:hypothetical protein MXB_2826, partial [Myxobolus squamalis]
FYNPIEILDITTNDAFAITLHYLIPQKKILFLQLGMRKDNTTIKVAECNNAEKVENLGDSIYTEMVQSFTLNKIVLQNIPLHLNDYGIYVCSIHRVKDAKLKKTVFGAEYKNLYEYSRNRHMLNYRRLIIPSIDWNCSNDTQP